MWNLWEDYKEENIVMGGGDGVRKKRGSSRGKGRRFTEEEKREK